MPQITTPPTPINRISPLVAAEFLGAAPAVAGSLPSAAAADHLHPLSPVPRKVVGFGLAQTLGAASGANATAYLYCRPVDLPAGAGKWTIEGWLVWPSTTQSFGLFDGATGELYPGSPIIAFVAGGGLGPLNINGFFGGSNIATIAGSPITGHFAITCDGSATRYFINGSLLLTQPAAAFPAGAYFGALVSSNGQGGNSLTADEWRVSTVARYTAAFSPPTAPFIPDSDTWALWHMDDTALGYWFAIWSGTAGEPATPIAAWIQNTANDGVTPTIFEDVSYDSSGGAHELWAAATLSGGLGINPPHFTTIEGVASPFGPESSAGTSLLVSSLQGQTGDLELVTPAGGSAVLGIIAGNGTAPTQLQLATGGALATAYEQELTATTPTTVLSYTPTTSGLLEVAIYFRVTGAATDVTVTVTTTDAGGAQTFTPLPLTSKPIGSYTITPLLVVCVSGQPLSIVVTAGTANQVFASSSILQG